MIKKNNNEEKNDKNMGKKEKMGVDTMVIDNKYNSHKEMNNEKKEENNCFFFDDDDYYYYY